MLPGFHADPCIIRAGDTYYVANSTFEWYPGVDVYRSRDLRTWEYAASPLGSKRLLDMAGAAASCGIFAPCLSHDGSRFYLIFTNVRVRGLNPWNDTPNFLTTAPAIEGPWSDPVFLNASGIDPSLFHDDDGKKWLVNMRFDWTRFSPESRAHFAGIVLQEYSPAKKRLVGTPRKIFSGTELGITEGPHLYKRDGWYYLFCAEGGTGYDHAETVARSRNLSGPYEVHPHNPFLTATGWDTGGANACDSAGTAAPPHSVLRKAGHASLCDSPSGRSYIAFLAARPLPGTGCCVLGRETAIAEIDWVDGWPYLTPAPGGARFVEGRVQNRPPSSFAPPDTGPNEPETAPPPSTSSSKVYRFDGTELYAGKLRLHPDFKTLRVEPSPDRYSLTARPGFLRLRGGESPASCYHQTLLARRQTDFSFDVEARLSFAPKRVEEFAGLCYRYDESNQYLFTATYKEEYGTALFVQSIVGGGYKASLPIPVPAAALEAGILLGLTVRGRIGQFRYSLDGKTWRDTGPELDAAALSDDRTGGFTGAFIGMFCTDLYRYAVVADFEWFSYSPCCQRTAAISSG